MIVAVLCVFFIMTMLRIKNKENRIIEERVISKRILIRKRSMLWQVAKYHINGFVATMVSAAFLSSILLNTHRIDLVTSLIIFFVILIYVSVMHIPVIVMLMGFYRQMGCVENFDAIFREKYLSFVGIGWGYIDQDWFICVDKGIACLLPASQIDFSRGAKYETRTWSVIHGYAYERNLNLYTYTGKILRVRITPNVYLHKWIEYHGGRVMN